MVKSFEGKWDRDKKVLELAYLYFFELGLRDRIISDKKILLLESPKIKLQHEKYLLIGKAFSY